MPRGIYAHKSRPLPERFWSKVEKTDACWLWRGGVKPNGYGRFVIGHSTQVYAHRFAWELTNGAVADGLFVCHHCDTPLCVRPDHLFLGTHTENMRDMLAKGRHFTPWRRRTA